MEFCLGFCEASRRPGDDKFWAFSPRNLSVGVTTSPKIGNRGEYSSTIIYIYFYILLVVFLNQVLSFSGLLEEVSAGHQECAWLGISPKTIQPYGNVPASGTSWDWLIARSLALAKSSGESQMA